MRSSTLSATSLLTGKERASSPQVRMIAAVLATAGTVFWSLEQLVPAVVSDAQHLRSLRSPPTASHPLSSFHGSPLQGRFTQRACCPRLAGCGCIILQAVRWCCRHRQDLDQEGALQQALGSPPPPRSPRHPVYSTVSLVMEPRARAPRHSSRGHYLQI